MNGNHSQLPNARIRGTLRGGAFVRWWSFGQSLKSPHAVSHLSATSYSGLAVGASARYADWSPPPVGSRWFDAIPYPSKRSHSVIPRICLAASSHSLGAPAKYVSLVSLAFSSALRLWTWGCQPQ